MKYTIEGFSQQYAMTLKKEVEVNGKTVTKKIDCTDLVILRWFVDFYPNMEKAIIEGKEYAWLKHNKLKEDLPLLDISKRSLIDRMQKLVDFGILDYQLKRKKGSEAGTFSFYRFGSNYVNLIRLNVTGDMQSNNTGDMQSNAAGVVQSNDTGYDDQLHNKDQSIINSSFSNSSNSNIGEKRKRFVPPSVEEVKQYCIERKNNVDPERFVDYYTANGWQVGKNKMKDWKASVRIWERNSFDSKAGKTYGATGVEIKNPAEDDLAGIF